MSGFKCIHNVYNQHRYLFPGHFHHPKQTVRPLNTNSQLPAPGPWQPACAFSLCDAACCRVSVSGLVQDSLLVSGWSHWACPLASSLCRVGCPLLCARAPVYSAQCTCSGYTRIGSGHSACSHRCHGEGCCCRQSHTSIFWAPVFHSFRYIPGHGVAGARAQLV